MVQERPFFEVRYAYPGFLFLFLILLSNAPGIVKVLTSSPYSSISPELGAAILGVAFLLNGAPIGFLVAQPWFIFQRRVLYNHDEFYGMIRDSIPGEPSREEIIVKADLWAWGLKDEDLLNYVVRRVDVMNILGSVGSAIFWALVASLVLHFLGINGKLQDALFWSVWSAGLLALLAVGFGLKDVRREQVTALVRLYRIRGPGEYPPRSDSSDIS